ncbi:MAG: FtsH protease activity modulator HflK [Candidatus Auribacterota bacterium]
MKHDMPGHTTERSTDYDLAHKSLMDALRISFRILQAAMLFVVLGFLCSGIFVVKQHETALILRFGNVVGTPADRVLKAGLHWAWPYPIDTVIKVPSGRIQSLSIDSFWYKDTGADKKKTPRTLRPGIDGYIICGDVNLVHAVWTLRYQIIDPYAYVLKVNNEEQLLKRLFNNAVISAAGSLTVDNVLKTGIEEFRRAVEQKTQANLANLDCGIQVQRIDIERIAPPVQVKDAFSSVIQAEQEHSQKTNEARSYAAKLLNEAAGQAAGIESAAQAYKTNSIEQAKADAGYLAEVLDQYNANPALFQFMVQQKAVKEILETVDDTFLFSNTDVKRDIRLLHNKSQKD